MEAQEKERICPEDPDQEDDRYPTDEYDEGDERWFD